MKGYSQAPLATTLLCVLGLVAAVQAEPSKSNPANKSNPAGHAPKLGSGKLIGLSVWPESFTITGADHAQQLLITGRYENGGVRDLTEQVKLTTDAKVIRVEGTATVLPVADGKSSITAEFEGHKATAVATVSSTGTDLPINFTNEIIPIFSKLTCNSGGCHGKSGGQNGFRLSLLGFVPELDYETLTRESRGRRLFPAAPERSLLLLKAVGALPHGGGKRMEPNSPEYKLITRWVRMGTPFGSDKDPKVVRISVEPAHRIIGLRSRQQITVTAHYSDGSTEDVTRRAEYSSNDQEIATVDEHGIVSTLELPGEGAIMARYLGHVSVFRATVPLGVPAAELAKVPRPKPTNFIDEHVFAKLDQLGIPPSQICDDTEFLRRASLDICGTLPTAEEVTRFLSDQRPDKRARLVDALLDRPEYASYFAVKWADILRNQKGTGRRGNSGATSTVAFHTWIRQAIADNMPYDQFVRSVIAAQGNVLDHPPVAWYRELTTPEALVDDTAQAFLGTRIQCARCHHHPYEKWSQDDYWGFASFYARVGRKVPIGASTQNNPDRNIFVTRAGLSRNPNTNQTLEPRGLDAEPLKISPDADPRDKLADWMSDPQNSFFAPALANRYWAHFFSRGIVEPIDDMRVTNPPSNPALLAALADSFVKSKFNTRELIRNICTSTTYQLSAMPNAYNKSDKQNFARYMPKRLSAEVLLDAIDQVLAVDTKFNNLPDGSRAIELPDEAENNYFLTVFGKPKRDSACECERTTDANLAQSLHLLNSKDIQNKLSAGNARPARLAADPRPEADKLTEIWMTVLGRAPTADELSTATQYIAERTDAKKPELKRAAYEDVFWALINTKAFLFNH